MSNKSKLRAAARKAKCRKEGRAEVKNAVTVTGKLPDLPTRQDIHALLTRPRWRPGRRAN